MLNGLEQSIRSECIVTRVTRYKESDLLLRLLTPHLGIISAIARSGQRDPKIDLLQRFNVVAKKRYNLYWISELSMLTDFHFYSRDVTLFGYGNYILELAYLTTPPEAGDTAIYDLLQSALGVLPRLSSKRLIRHWFEWQIVKLSGFAPQVTRCAKCLNTVNPRTRYYIVPDLGEICCQTCFQPQVSNTPMLAAAVLQIISTLLESTYANIHNQITITDDQDKLLSALYQTYLKHKLGISVRSARFLDQLEA